MKRSSRPPRGYYSQMLVLIGQADAIVGEHGFTMTAGAADAPGAGNEGLLVLDERGDVIVVDDAFANRRV